ncbi:CDP-Glycerol:Poly(Glycerophosphate) glycerophosphotransferase [Streptomyces sp. KY75]|nr:CDP-Glycerol:Poly(Glycerophosphate) glycerophosphotransferase [Streptomyces sp. KY75]CAD5985961.1 CDP-Glycerol:Poly(Glycerophosphate) glycerophosphotransferase [Streptomyces sp. KY70]
MISTAIRLARVGSRSELAAALLMGLGYPCVMLAALLPNIWFFAATAAVTYAADWYLHQRGSYLINRLGKVRAGLSIRFLLRQLMLVLLLARMGLAEEPLFYTAVACFLIFYGLQAPQGAVTTLIRLRRTMPVVTRNVDLHSVRIPDAPPGALLRRSGEKMLHLDIAAMAGILIAAGTGEDRVGFVGAALTLLLGFLYVVALIPYLRRSRLVPPAGTVLKAVDTWLREYQPTVVLYFSGSNESAYQGNMWLDTMARVEGRPLIVMRERNLVPQLAETSVPVLCVPAGTHLMNLDLSSARVCLYPANVGKNIHILRVPTMKHVFIGHGDSDKLASVNPYSKVYDEVWTAGRAGRDRYALADVGVRDEDIVEVGRPQLEPIKSWTGEVRNPIPTVLYAPTWEGWDDNPGNTSLLLAGENIVRRLLAADDPVRIIYKPHPFTGIRSRQAKAVDAKIRAMLGKAAAERAAEPRWAAEAERTAAERSAAQAELVRINARLTELAAVGRAGGDEAEESRVSLADPAREAEAAQLRAAWNEAYWRSFGWWEHRTVVGAEPKLYDCFNESDAMVSDISSVVSDFIASGKPYAVTDSAALGAEEFKRQNTAVRAAVILSNSAEELDELLAAVADPAADALAGARRELKSYLLGPDEPTSMEQFNAAVRALAAKAEARNAGVAQRLGGQVIAVPDREGAPGDSAVTGEPEAPAEAGAVADPDAVGVSAVAAETAVEAAAETAVTEGASPR